MLTAKEAKDLFNQDEENQEALAMAIGLIRTIAKRKTTYRFSSFDDFSDTSKAFVVSKLGDLGYHTKITRDINGFTKLEISWEHL